MYYLYMYLYVKLVCVPHRTHSMYDTQAQQVSFVTTRMYAATHVGVPQYTLGIIYTWYLRKQYLVRHSKSNSLNSSSTTQLAGDDIVYHDR